MFFASALLWTACGSGISSAETRPDAGATPDAGSPPDAGQTPTPVNQTWHAAAVVGSAAADFGTLTYAPGGFAHVQYSVLSSGQWALSTAIQSGSGFSSPTSISSNDRQASLFFADPSDVWASAESASLLHIYRSTDAGASWALQASSIAQNNPVAGPAWDRSGWIDNGSGNLQVFFGTIFHNDVFGDHPEVHSLAYAGGAWAASEVAPALATDGPMIGVFRSGSDIMLSNGSANFSQDNGKTYAEEQTGGSADQNINSTGGVALASGAIYAVNSYTYGPGGAQFHYAVWKSTDFGHTWAKVFTSAGTAWAYDFTSIAAVGNLVVAEVVQEASGGSGSPQVIQYVASADGGATWIAPSQLIDVSILGNKHVVGLQLAASPNGRMGSIYSLEPGATGSGLGGAGVYFSEFY